MLTNLVMGRTEDSEASRTLLCNKAWVWRLVRADHELWNSDNNTCTYVSFEVKNKTTDDVSIDVMDQHQWTVSYKTPPPPLKSRESKNSAVTSGPKRRLGGQLRFR